MVKGSRKRPLVVMDLAALSGRLLASGDCPHLAAYARTCKVLPVKPVFPALTLPMQATIMTGVPPAEPGSGWVRPRRSRSVGKMSEVTTGSPLVRGSRTTSGHSMMPGTRKRM